MELATQSEFDEVLNRHHNIQYVDAIFTDLCGYVRGKRFPVLEADKIFSDGNPWIIFKRILDFNSFLVRGDFKSEDNSWLSAIVSDKLCASFSKASNSSLLTESNKAVEYLLDAILLVILYS